MPDPEAVAAIVREWIVKAENDLRNAAHTLTLKEDVPTDTICFHAQQCIEKYLKAFLVSRSIAFTKTHSLRVLMELIPQDSRPSLDGNAQDQITKYAAVSRYPDAGLDIPLPEARKAVATARRIRKEVRRLLPRAALRRKRKP